MLVRGPIGCCEANLGQGVLESTLLGCLGVTKIGFEIPAGLLCDLANNQATRNVGDPVAFEWK